MKIQKLLLNLAPAVLLTNLLFASSVQASCAAPLIGSICVTAANFCPRGYSEANGAEIAVNNQEALFSVIGTTYGGNGRSTFRLPDLRGRIAIATGRGSGLTSVARGSKKGADSITLTQQNLPNHTHEVAVSLLTPPNVPVDVQAVLSTQKGSSAAPISGVNQLKTVARNALSSNPEAKIYGAMDASTSTNYLVATGEADMSLQQFDAQVSMMNTGSNNSINIGDPKLGLTYCIAMIGTYPRRP